MDLSSLKNMNVNDLFSNLKNSQLLKDKKFLINFVVGFGAILIFLIGYYFFVNPTLKDQKEKIATMNDNKSKIEEFSKSYDEPEKAVQWFYEKQERLNEPAALATEDNVVNFVLKACKIKKEKVSFDELMGNNQ